MQLVSSKTISTALPRCKTPAVWAEALNPALNKYGIVTVARISSFLAQTGYESDHFNRLVENLNYTSSARLAKIWPKRFADPALAAQFVSSPEKLGNCQVPAVCKRA